MNPEIGYVRRGRGYAQVKVLARYDLPGCKAVRWRFNGKPDTISESERVLPKKPLTTKQQYRVDRYAELKAILSAEWQSVSAIAEKFHLAYPAEVAGMCSMLMRKQEVEMRRVKFEDGDSHRCWRWELRLKTSPLTTPAK